MPSSLKEHIGKLLRQSAVYGVGHIVSRSLGFLLLPLYTNTIPTDDYGFAAVLFSFLGIMHVFYSYGMDVAYLRYVALQEDVGKQKILFSTGFISLLTSAIILSVILILVRDKVSLVLFHTTGMSTLILLSAGILFFDCLAQLPFMALRAKQKSIQFASLKLASVIINIGANILFIIVLKNGVAGIFQANLVSSAITFVIVMPVFLRQFRLHFERESYFALIRFGLPYIPSGLAVVIMDLIDRIILERMAGAEVTGVYSAGYKLGMFMALFIAAFRFAWHPFFLSTSKQTNATQVFGRVLTYFVLSCAFVFLLISLYVNDLVRIKIFGFTLFGEEYWGGTAVVPIIMISYIFYGIYVNFLVGIYLHNKTYYLPWITGLAALVNIIANLILIPPMGQLGAAWATAIAYTTMAVFLYYRVRLMYPVPYEWLRIGKVAVVVLTIFILQIYIFQFQEILSKAIWIVVFFVLLWLSGFMKKSEKQYLRRILSRSR
jgi:O-antigen/teichoic acid export membrane protein